MKSLQELARVISEYRLDNVAAFTLENRQEKDSMYNQFLDGILEGKFHTDEDAAKTLYNADTDDVKYRVLKNRLKQRIYNNVLFLDAGKRSASSYAGTYHSLYRQLVVAKFLIGVSAKEAGYELLAKVLQKAEKYEIHDIVQQAALHFRRQSMMGGDTKKFEQYNQVFKYANERLIAEATAEELYYAVMIHFNQSASHPKSLIEKAKLAAELIRPLREQSGTYNLHYYEHSIESIYYQLINDFKAAISSCERFEKYLLKNEVFYTDARFANLLVTKASCYLHDGEFEKGIEAAEKAKQLYAAGTENWFIVLELYFLLALNSNKLKIATRIYTDVIKHPRFEYNRPQQVESWKIFGGYLWFMLNYLDDKECIEIFTSGDHSFRFSKLLNEVPHFARDKKGMNVAILILQVLLLIEKKEYVDIISRNDALNSYLYRNLDKDDAVRSHHFIKMLINLEKAQFDPIKAKQKNEGLLQQLREGSLNYATTQTRMEIIPYERLWEIILSLLA